jgi:hypothetical protein
MIFYSNIILVTIDVTKSGAFPDGVTLNTAALQNLIEECRLAPDARPALRWQNVAKLCLDSVHDEAAATSR